MLHSFVIRHKSDESLANRMNEPTYVEGFHDKEAVQKMTYAPLGNTGLRVSKMGLGGAPLGGLFESIEQDEAASIVEEAVRSGINYIDTAPFYGQGKSESAIGRALKNIPRKAYYIATKVARYTWDLHDQFDYSAERTRQSVERSLELLGLDYVDVIQIHDIEYAENLDQIINETLPTLQKIVDEGKARYIGVTSYVLNSLKEVLERSKVKIDCVLTVCRYTLIDDELTNYMPFFQEKGVAIIHAGALGLGLLTFRGPSEWHPANSDLKKAAKNAAEYCKTKNIDISKLAIQYSCALEGVPIQLIGVATLEYLKQNLKIVTQSLSKDELKVIEEIRQK
ncbi:L-galactose dehydrogenase [Armadillidium vulgare]|nr:L-galactose dehydrogenase [Armadillidium vulgare]